MAVIGGDFTEIRWSHPTLGDGVVYPKSNEGSTLDLGGFRANDDENQITTAGDLILQMNRVRGFLEVVVANDSNVNKDLLKIKDLAGNAVSAVWTISHKSGITWRGSGHPVGSVQADMNAATFTLKIAVNEWKEV